MGNMKYPLNGKYLTLGDLIYEFGFNTARPSDKTSDIYVNYEKIIDNITENLGSTNVSNSEIFTNNKFLTDCSIDISYITDSSSWKNCYESFKNDILNPNIEGRCKATYEICYFPDVYSTEQRDITNKSYIKILEGDYEWFSPDRYIRLEDVNTINPTMEFRIPTLFHYVYNEINSADSKYSDRFSFNYKRGDGLATASYALQLLINLQSEYDEYNKNNPGDKIEIDINTLLFGTYNDSSYTYDGSISNGQNTFESLLFNYKDFVNNIIDSSVVTPNAYKWLLNYEYRKNGYILQNNKIILDKDNTNTFDNIILQFFNVKDDYLEYLNNTTYYTYDFISNDNIPESTDYKRLNLYNKTLYYINMLIGSQTYKTGLILDAKFDVLNEKHIYKMTDPLYKCDVGANISVSNVEYDTESTSGIICNYALPARALKSEDTIIAQIPVKIYSALNKSTTVILKRWNMSEVKKLLTIGLTLSDNTELISYEYMELYQYINGKYTKYDNIDIKTLCDSSMGKYGDSYKSVTNKNDISPDSSLNIYNPINNAGWNTERYYNENEPKLFVGKLRANINYSLNVYFKCDIPIYRLTNYYYDETVVINRENYIYFIDFSTLSNDDREREKIDKIPHITYELTINQNNSGYKIYANLDTSLYLSSYTGNQINRYYISNPDVAVNLNINSIGAYSKISVIVNEDIDHPVNPKNLRIIPLYELKPDNDILVIFGKDLNDSYDSTTIYIYPISNYTIQNAKQLDIYNLQEIPISVLLTYADNISIFTGLISQGNNTGIIKGNNITLLLCTEKLNDKQLVITLNKYYIIIGRSTESTKEIKLLKYITNYNDAIINNDIANGDIIYIYDQPIYKFNIIITNSSDIPEGIMHINSTNISLPDKLTQYNNNPNIIYTTISDSILTDKDIRDHIENKLINIQKFDINSISHIQPSDITTYNVELTYNPET